MGRRIDNSVGFFLGALSLFLLVKNTPVNAESYMFVFGDSLFDPGNNVFFDPDFPSAKCPYGMTVFNHPNGRLSDGLLVPDFIALRLGIPLIPPVLDETADLSYGASFASAGLGVLDTHPNVMNLGTQFEKFVSVVEKWTEELGEAEAKRRLTKAVYLISMGGNDYFSRLTEAANATFTEHQEYVDHVISEFSKVLKDIYKKGARKFVFQSVGCLGCLPVVKNKFNFSKGCVATPLTLATLHNAALYKMAESIQSSPEYSEFLYAIFDFYTSLETRIRNPEEFGFKVGDAVCYNKDAESKPPPSGYNCTDTSGVNPFNGELCSNPSEYVFFDDGHNTNELNRQLSELIWSGGPDFVYPYNVEHLVHLDLTAAKNGCAGEDKSVCSA